jgi:hypothetical protein
MLASAAVLSLVLAAGVSVLRAQEVSPGVPGHSGLTLYARSWAVVVGIDRFKDRSIPRLHYAANDGRAVALALKGLGFAAENITLLVDERATRAEVERILSSTIRRATGPQDRLVVFFATHGVTVPLPAGGEEGYLLLHDSDPEDLPLTALGMNQFKQIGQRIPAKHIFVAVDACYGGYSLVRAVTPPALDRRYLELIAQSRVIQVMTAGKRDQPVVEELGHGVFTRKLLEGLAGHADENRDGMVTVGELAAWMHPRVAQASDYKQDMQWGTLDGEGQVVFVLPASAGVPAGDETSRLREEQRRLSEERMRVETERQRLEAERSRLEASVPPQAAVDPTARGRLLFDLELKRQPPDVDIAVGNQAVDRVRFTGQAAEVSLRGKTFAAIGIAGREFDDFVAEVRVAPIKGDGYVAVQSRVGDTAYYAVRVLPFAGTLSVTRAPKGRHDIRDEAQLSAPFLRFPIVQPGADMVFTVVQRGPELVVYVNGAEAARARDASLARGRVELAFGTLSDSFQVHVRSFRVWALSGR